MSSAKRMLRPDSSEKQRMLKSSGGTYSKPDARVKLIPAEEITYVRHRKPYCRTVGLAGLQKRHCRRSITPPPSSRKVSVVPMPSASSYKLTLSPKRLETAENGDSLVGEHATSSATHQISCLKNPAPPSCKSLQPSIYSASPSLKQVLAPRSSEDHVGTKEGPSSKSICTLENEESLSSASVFHQQPTVVYPDRIRSAAPMLRKHILPSPISLPSVMSTEVHPNSKSGQKEAAMNPFSPNSKQVLSPHSSHHLSAKAGAPSKSVCTPQNGKSCSTSCNITARSTTAPVLQSSIVDSALLNPTPVLGERSRDLCPDETRTAIAPNPKNPIVKHSLPSPTPLLSERSTDVYPNSKAGLTEAVTNHHSPTPKQVLAPCSSEDHLGTKAGPPSNSVCTAENELFTRSCNVDPVLQSPILESATVFRGTSTEVYPDIINAAVPTQQGPITEHVLPSPTSLVGERSNEVHPNSSTGLCSDRINTAFPTQQGPITEHVLPSPTSLVGERSNEVHPNSLTGICSSNNLLNRECDTVLPHHKSIPQTHSLQFSAPAKCSTSINCDTSTEFLHKGVQETGAPAILHTKLHKKKYQSEAPWKGKFHVTGKLKHICDGLKAQFPFQVFFRVYEASKQMPEILKLEAVALSQLWPKMFKMKPPDGQDIGLFFTSSHERPHRSFDHLIEKISSHIGLWTNIGGTELSIFSSQLLSPDYQRKDGKFYFWGIFGKHLRKNQCHHSNHITSMKNSNPVQPNEDSDDKSADTVAKLDATEVKETESFQPENGMTVDPIGGKEREIGNSKESGSTIDVTGDNVIVSNKNEGFATVLDVTGDNETDKVNECAVVLRSPNSYPASSCAAPAFLNGCCSRDTTNKSTFSVADLMLDKPPVFTKNDRVDEYAVVLGTPDSNSASNDIATASLLDGCCSHVSANKSTSSLTDSPCKPANISSAGSTLTLDTPNGFSLKTDGINGCNMVLGTPNSDPASGCAAPVVSLPSRCFGHDWNKSTFSLSGFRNNIPPGFTEAHCRLPTISSTEPETGVSTSVTEKKPLIRFSLNVPRLEKTESLPGFTTPNTVNKEHESPAVDKAAKNPTQSPLAPGASSVRKAGLADGRRITRDKVTVEDDENSEERELPKIRRLSELYGTPQSCTEVCMPVSSNLADKFQATEQPEKQRHQGKRGMQEPPEPSLADTAKRLKVNGRLALNTSIR